jgi:glycosyltransferase involved in cell wall biosynthesis
MKPAPLPRILIIPSWYPPDGGYFFKEHCEAISGMGWRVDVLVNRLVGVRKMIRAGARALHRFREGEENGLHVIRCVTLKIPGNERLNIRRWAARTVRFYDRYAARYGRPGLIMTHSVTWAGYAASLIAARHRIPYLIVEHRSFFVWRTEHARRMVKPFYLPFFEQAYRNCSRLVLVSPSLLHGLKSLMPWIGEHTIVIPNMIRGDMFLPPAVPRKSDPFVFLWAGRLAHVKGVDVLLEAVRILEERTDRAFSVRLAGRGPLRKELEEMASVPGVAGHVHFLGRLSRDRIQKEMQAASCFLLASRYEAFGVVLIEAMATGLPVIATRSGGPEFIVTPQDGLLVEPERAEQLADAMEKMIREYPGYSQQGIRESAMKRFGAPVVLEQYDRLFWELLEGEL